MTDAPEQHLVPADVDAGAAVLTRWERRVVLGLWLLACWLPALGLWVLEPHGFDLEFGTFVWLVTLAVTTPLISRVLGHVGVLVAAPPEVRPLLHLSPALARMVHEAAAIREDLGHDLESALERAWHLTCAFDQLPPEQRADLAHSHAALAPVRALFDQRVGPGRSHAAHTRRVLAAALTDFIASLAEPTLAGFR